MKSSSIKMVDAGIADPRGYRDELINEWYMREDYAAHLTVYILRETRPELLFFHIKDGELFLGNKSYSIVWINPPSACREANRLLISLRYCSYLERGYALVKILQGSNHDYERLEYKQT